MIFCNCVVFRDKDEGAEQFVKLNSKKVSSKYLMIDFIVFDLWSPEQVLPANKKARFDKPGFLCF